MSSSPITGLSLPLLPGKLSRRAPYSFVFQPDAAARKALAEDLGVLGIRKLLFSGALIAEGRADWRLEATLGATAVQECVVSGAPVTTRIDQKVVRRYLEELPESPAGESEAPEDDSLEPLGHRLDPGEALREALALALPDYPRAEGASLAELGAEPEAEEEEEAAERPNPFAALAKLKDLPE